MSALPRLRGLEVTVVETEEKENMVTLRDPEGISPETVMMAPASFMVASLLDGKRDAKEIQKIFAQQFQGHILTEAEIKEVVAKLDNYGFLETEKYRKRKGEVRADFAKLAVRPASHAGTGYPADRLELAALVRDSMKSTTGGGLIVPAGSRAVPRGLVAPHIDFARGARVYGSAHRVHEGAKLPPLVVVIGVVHAGAPEPFILTRKPFETPLGKLDTATEVVDEIEKAAGVNLTAEEYAHRNEHSIEFQLVWLQELHADEKFRIVPILVSAFEQFTGQASPLYDERIARTMAGLREEVRKSGALVLASVDWSHVGPRFGDEVELTETLRGKVREADRALMEKAAAGDSEAFWVEALRDGNARHVDALSAVYSLIRILSPVEGTILDYDIADDPAGGIVGTGAIALR